MLLFEEKTTIEKTKKIDVQELQEDIYFLSVEEKEIEEKNFQNEVHKNEKNILKEYVLSKKELDEYRESDFKELKNNTYMVLPSGILKNLDHYKYIMEERKENIFNILEEYQYNSINYPITFIKGNNFEIASKICGSLIMNENKEVIPQPVLLGYLDGFNEDFFYLDILVEDLNKVKKVKVLKNECEEFIFSYMNIEKGMCKNYILMILELNIEDIELIKKYCETLHSENKLDVYSGKNLSNILINSGVLNISRKSIKEELI